MVNDELSLLNLYNILADIKTSYGEKINYLHSIFDGYSDVPDGVTNSNDAPGLWPAAGATIFAIVPEYVLAEAFCSSGVIVNLAANGHRFQLMLTEFNDVYPDNDGSLRYRFADLNTDSWSEWITFATLIDIKNMQDTLRLGLFTVLMSEKAKSLATPRKIMLSGVLNGEATFDGTADAIIKVTSSSVMPINIVVPTSNYGSEVKYLHVATLPPSSNSTHDILYMLGHIGGWTKGQGKAAIHLVASNRDGWNASGMVLGSLGNVDLLLVDDVDTDELKVYLQLTGYVGKCELSLIGDQVSIVNEYVDALPSPSVWQATTNATIIGADGRTSIKHVELADTSDVAKGLETTEIPSGDAGIRLVVGKSPIGPSVSTSPDVKIDIRNGVVYANKFISTDTSSPNTFDGNASTSTVADRAEALNVIHNQTVKAYVVGVVQANTGSGDVSKRMQPYYDSQVFLDTAAGKLTSTSLSTSTLTATTGTITTVNGMDVNVTNNLSSPRLTLKASTPIIDLHYDNSSSYTTRLSATSSSMLTCSSNFTATKVYNAVWNDYAEYFPRGEATEPGDVIVLDLKAADERYVRSRADGAPVVGVHSDEYGHIIGGEAPPMGVGFEEHNAVRYIPVALAGRVRVKFVGLARKGDKVVATTDGCARRYTNGDDPADVIGFLVEADNRTDVRRLRIKLTM